MKYFTKFEKTLWVTSVILIILSFIIFDKNSYMTLIASLIGVTSLIFNAKGNPFGQVLMIVFSILYGIISFGFAYYGEMITYLGMTLPMSVFSLIAWLKNPFGNNKSEVAVSKVSNRGKVLLYVSAVIVTVIFYFVLKYFNTSNLLFSTVSVTTSYVAAYLTFMRSPYFAVAYASNDVVLIVLWTLASFFNKTYISVVVCFVVFLANDLYTYVNWKRIEKRQKKTFA